MLTTPPAELSERRRSITRAPVLARLRERLRGMLDPLLAEPIYLPEQKALLSRDGGICPDDGSRLRFDPFSPYRHQCPRCGRWLEGDRHHRGWITRYQIWLSERAIHLALIGALDSDPVLLRRASELLLAYADRYRSYPNRDNVLGPTRLFFSTYLESIWLCQVTVAAALVDAVNGMWPSGGRDRVRQMVAESASLIGSFDEAWSNRQVWNNAALIGAGRWLEAPELVTPALNGPHGLRAQLRHCVSADGLWFEGENYHFFALRGLLLGAEMLRREGPDLYADSAAGSSLAALYVAPLKTVLPDLTLPARSDAPFGVSLRQPRFAELWEMGRARTRQPAIERILADLYASPPSALSEPEEDYGRSELAEQEQNRPPQQLSREGLGWKALLWMLEASPSGSSGEWHSGSVLLADHGLAVLRQGGRYASLECGGRPGGHGHPDLLHVTLYWGGPWLLDYGTGSYVSPSLHWYRSTLAHNAPGLAGSGQLSRDAVCEAFSGVDDWAWVRAHASDVFGARYSATRTLVAGPDWVLDVVEIDAPPTVEVDLACHLLGSSSLPAGVERIPGGLTPPAPAGAESGYDAILTCSLLSETPVRLRSHRDGQEMFAVLLPRPGERCYLASAVGPPDLNFAEGQPLEFLVRRASGDGRWVQLYAPEPVTLEERGSEIAIVSKAGTQLVTIGDDGARIRSGSDAVTLTGIKKVSRPRAQPASARANLPCPILKVVPQASRWIDQVPETAIHALGAANYRRSEDAYDPADFSARIAVFGADTALCFGMDIAESELVVRRPEAPDPGLDNEPADIHSDGVQCYVDFHGWQGFLLVPDLDSTRVYIRPVSSTAADPRRMTAEWEPTSGGYRMLARFDVGRPVHRGDRFPVNLVVNRMRPGRERRAGQLALSGGGGWIYLRGDRESPDTAVIAEIT